MNYAEMQAWHDIKNLATQMEALANIFNMHVALTGGQLYKEGDRKDIDLIAYNHRLEGTPINSEIPADAFMTACNNTIVDFHCKASYGFVHKATWKGYSIDVLFPETLQGDYEEQEPKADTKHSHDKEYQHLFFGA